MISLILAIIIVLVSSAVCSMTEAALFSVPINRVRAWVKGEVRFAATLLKIKEHLYRPIATIVILNNISNIVGSMIVGWLTIEHLSNAWLGIISGSLTFLVIIFSEIIPKTIGERKADEISLLTAEPVYVLTKIFSPFLFLIEIITRPIIKSKSNQSVSEEEIKILARLGTREGILEKEEEAIIRNALILNDIKVKNIMTPRMMMKSFDGDLRLRDIKAELTDSPYSRYPLFKGNVDQIIGLLYKTDAFINLSQGKEKMHLHELSREVLFVPENKPIDKLMEELRITQSHTAIVVDEYGGTAGLASLEDILEVIVGDIVGENDENEYHLDVIAETEVMAHGFTLIDEVNRFFNTNLENHKTISKMILEELNRFPEPKEEIQVQNLIFIIEQVTPRIIEKVRIKKVILDED